MKLILASASPRRQQLLQQFSLPFLVHVADIDESPLAGESVTALVIRLAQQKAQAVYQHYGTDYRVLGGDTMVCLDAKAFGKPKNFDEASTMLHQLSGRTHQVYSAVALVDHAGIRSRLSQTDVTFHTLDTAQIAAYCQTTDPYDKAGAYGIQGLAGSFVQSIEGSYSGVIGLPLWHTHQLLFSQS